MALKDSDAEVVRDSWVTERIDADGPYDREFWYQVGLRNMAQPVTEKLRVRRLEALKERQEEAYRTLNLQGAEERQQQINAMQEEAARGAALKNTIWRDAGDPPVTFRFAGAILKWKPFREIDYIQLPPGCGDINTIEPSSDPTGIRIFADYATLFLSTRGEAGKDWTLTVEIANPPRPPRVTRPRTTTPALFRTEAEFKERTAPAARAMAENPGMPLTFEVFRALCRVEAQGRDLAMLRKVFEQVYEPAIREQRAKQLAQMAPRVGMDLIFGSQQQLDAYLKLIEADELMRRYRQQTETTSRPGAQRPRAEREQAPVMIGAPRAYFED